MNSLYKENHILGRLFKKFMDLFPQATKPTKKLLALFLIGQLYTEHFTSVRNLHKTFLSNVCDKKLNSYYHALSNDKLANSQIRQMLASTSLSIIPESLAKEPVMIAIDDTTIAKFGKKFANVQCLYDHSIHDSQNRMVNGHCFVSLTMSVPVIEARTGHQQQIRYVPISIGYAMWTPEKSKLELATELLAEIMPMLKDKQVILCFDSWYAKKKLIDWALSHSNVNIICNARHDTVMWDLPEPTSGKRGRPKKYGDKLSLDSIKDFHGEINFGKYKVTHRIVKTNLFGNRSVHAYVTSNYKGSHRLFFSTASVAELHISCAWHEDSKLRNCPAEEAFLYPLKLYKLRWSIETNYYEQKTFWSIDKYMVRKHIGIERLLNMINIAHSMTKILPYTDNMFCKNRNMSAQECRHTLRELINKEIFFASLADCAQTAKNSAIIMEFLEAMGWNECHAA